MNDEEINRAIQADKCAKQVTTRFQRPDIGYATQELELTADDQGRVTLETGTCSRWRLLNEEEVLEFIDRIYAAQAQAEALKIEREEQLKALRERQQAQTLLQQEQLLLQQGLLAIRELETVREEKKAVIEVQLQGLAEEEEQAPDIDLDPDFDGEGRC